MLIKRMKGWLHFRIYRANLHFDLVLCQRWKWRRYLAKNSKILEIGPGGGPWSIELLIKENHVTVVDVDSDSLSRLRKKVEAFPLRNKDIKLICSHIGNFNSWEKYDQIILFEVLEHIKEDELVVKKLSALLMSGGEILISTPSDDHEVIIGERLSAEEDGGHVRKGYSFDDYQRILSKNGLKVVRRDSCAGFFTRKSTALINLFNEKIKIKGLAYLAQLLLRPVTYFDSLYRDYPQYTNFVIARKTTNDN